MLLLQMQLMLINNPFRMRLLPLLLDVEVEVKVGIGQQQLKNYSKNRQLSQ